MKIPYYKQQHDYTCGPACAMMALACFGITAEEDELSGILGTNAEQGTEQKEFRKLAAHYSLAFIEKKDASLAELSELLGKGYAVIVCHHLASEKVSHYSVLKSVDSKSLVLLDPYIGADCKYSVSEFKMLWKIVEKKGREPCWFFAVKK
jgi:ABC-type bacteriocin/lantibiotic exporter with double-glycine peptidase domain